MPLLSLRHTDNIDLNSSTMDMKRTVLLPCSPRVQVFSSVPNALPETDAPATTSRSMQMTVAASIPLKSLDHGQR